MPTELKIPARTEQHCEPCEFHKCVGALHVRSGAGGWREYACAHPEAFEKLPTPSDPEKARKLGEIEARLRNDFRIIGKTDKQPDWCPLKRPPTEKALT